MANSILMEADAYFHWNSFGFLSPSSIRKKMKKTEEDIFDEVVGLFGHSKFSTDEFIRKLKLEYKEFYQDVVNRYGEGGKGSGTNYSAFSWIAAQLSGLSKKGGLRALPYEKAPPHWGSPVIRCWAKVIESPFPDEVSDDLNLNEFEEGGLVRVKVNRYERNPVAREECIQKKGVDCCVCGFNFQENYGDLGKDFIHIHHLEPVSSKQTKYKVSPANDLVPVCPNCHAMLHRTKPPLTIEELKALLVKCKK